MASRNQMDRQQLCRELLKFRRRKYPTSTCKEIEDVNKAGMLDFGEYTQWEQAYLDNKVTLKDIENMSKWLRTTNDYVLFKYLQKIVPKNNLEKRDWKYTHAFFATIIDITKVIISRAICKN
jgi:hypothetical protein